MKARARVEIDLISNAQRIFKFNAGWLSGAGVTPLRSIIPRKVPVILHHATSIAPR